MVVSSDDNPICPPYLTLPLEKGGSEAEGDLSFVGRMRPQAVIRRMEWRNIRRKEWVEEVSNV